MYGGIQFFLSFSKLSGSDKSKKNKAALEPLKYVYTIALNFSSPAKSQIYCLS